jgi:phage repressor protein C with HTH and peptisase S24 domain
MAFGGVGTIKRLRPQADGGVRLMSDNRSIRNEVAYDGELSITGRVVGVMCKV